MRYPAAFALANRRYRTMFTADNEQIRPLHAGRSSPTSTTRASRRRTSRSLRRPNLKAYVVTAERAARRYQELGVDKPYHVIPQGVSLSSADATSSVASAARAAARRARSSSAGWPRTCSTRERPRRRRAAVQRRPSARALGGDPRAAPAGRLWLVGGASERVPRRVAGRDDIVLFGRLPREQALATAANFDLAVYPRTEDTGIQAAKVGEFIGLGVPTVSYDYEVTENLRETGAGVLVPTLREFVDAVVRLGEDEAARARARGRGAAGRRRARLGRPRAPLRGARSSTAICRAVADSRDRARSAVGAGARASPVLLRRSRSARARAATTSAQAIPNGTSSISVSGSVTRARPPKTSSAAASAGEHAAGGPLARTSPTERAPRATSHGARVGAGRRGPSRACSAPRPRFLRSAASMTESTTFARPRSTSARAISRWRARAIRNCVMR